MAAREARDAACPCLYVYMLRARGALTHEPTDGMSTDEISTLQGTHVAIHSIHLANIRYPALFFMILSRIRLPSLPIRGRRPYTHMGYMYTWYLMQPYNMAVGRGGAWGRVGAPWVRVRGGCAAMPYRIMP